MTLGPAANPGSRPHLKILNHTWNSSCHVGSVFTGSGF